MGIAYVIFSGSGFAYLNVMLDIQRPEDFYLMAILFGIMAIPPMLHYRFAYFLAAVFFLWWCAQVWELSTGGIGMYGMLNISLYTACLVAVLVIPYMRGFKGWLSRTQ